MKRGFIIVCASVSAWAVSECVFNLICPGKFRSRTYISVLRHAHSTLVKSGNLVRGLEDGDRGKPTTTCGL